MSDQPTIGHAAFYPYDPSPNKGAPAFVSDGMKILLAGLPVRTTLFGPATIEADKQRIADLEAENAKLTATLADRDALVAQLAKRSDQLFNRLCRYEVPPQPEA